MPAHGSPLKFKPNPALTTALDMQMQQVIASGGDPMSDPHFQKLVKGGQIRYENGHVTAYDPQYDNGILAHIGAYAGKAGEYGLAATGAGALVVAAGHKVDAANDAAYANQVANYQAPGGSNVPTGERMVDAFGNALNSATNQAAQNRAAQQVAGTTGVNADAQALRNMSAASYVANGGQREPGDAMAGLASFANHQVPVRRPTRKVSDEEIAFSKAMRDSLLQRQRSGQSLTTSGIQAPSTMERIGQYAGPGMQMLDAFMQSRQQTPAVPTTTSPTGPFGAYTAGLIS